MAAATAAATIVGSMLFVLAGNATHTNDERWFHMVCWRKDAFNPFWPHVQKFSMKPPGDRTSCHGCGKKLVDDPPV